VTATPRRRLGDAGEAHARRHLEAKGYRFVTGGWRCARGELDLVMFDGVELVFVEVKTRHGEAMGRAEEAVGATKAKRLFATAELFLQEHAELGEPIWRVDLVAITLDRRGVVQAVDHYENAVFVD
jgi:putative endonuclease